MDTCPTCNHGHLKKVGNPWQDIKWCAVCGTLIVDGKDQAPVHVTGARVVCKNTLIWKKD